MFAKRVAQLAVTVSLAILGLILGFLISPKAQAAVWQNANSWNASWEEKYHQWVKSSWSTSVFSDSSLPYYKLKPDCADTVYAMRLIFAYNNKLPFEVVDPTNTNRTISNQMSRFDDRPAHERPRAFLAYLFNLLSTRSLPQDSYPVPVNTQQFRAGVFGLAVKSNHHSWTVKNINQYGVPLFYYSTTGVASRPVVELQVKNVWYNPYWVFEGAIQGDRAQAASHAGYRAFKWPSELKTPAMMVSKASAEQYQIPVSKWTQTVQSKLSSKSESAEQRLSRFLDDSCTNFNDRIQAVNDGWNYFRSKGGRCLTQEEFYQYSTPSRDKRALDELVDLRRSYQAALQNGSKLSSDLSKILKEIFPSPSSSFARETANMSSEVRGSYCSIRWASGKSISLAEARRRLARGLMSNNPHDDLDRRWGAVGGSSPTVKSCSNYNDTWTPNLSNY